MSAASQHVSVLCPPGLLIEGTPDIAIAAGGVSDGVNDGCFVHAANLAQSECIAIEMNTVAGSKTSASATWSDIQGIPGFKAVTGPHHRSLKGCPTNPRKEKPRG